MSEILRSSAVRFEAIEFAHLSTALAVFALYHHLGNCRCLVQGDYVRLRYDHLASFVAAWL